MATALERFMGKVSVEASGCWAWTASRYRNGYGQFDHGLAHRFAYAEFVGPIPEGLVLDHLCGQRHCVNPSHLEAVTQSTNARRGYVTQVMVAARRAAAADRTHCARGHELTESNTYVTPREGWRQCRKCKAIAKENRRGHVHA